MTKLEEKDYSVTEYIQKANEVLKDINYLSQKYIDVLLTLELADINPEIAFNFISLHLDKMKEWSDND